MNLSVEMRVPGGRPLQGMFMAVPPRYDLINRLITWGRDDGWRLRAARECLSSGPERVLDLCCGTGKLGMKVAGIAGDRVQTVAIDYSLPMLKLAVAQARGASRGDRLSFIDGDAAALPFPDACFDCVGISFAFRNLTYRNPLTVRYLAEVVRILRPGGRFVIVESSQPALWPVRRLFHLYLRGLVFRLGHLLSGNRGAYRYLAESAARFSTPDELRQLLISSGVRQFHSRPLMFGTVGLHVAVK